MSSFGIFVTNHMLARIYSRHRHLICWMSSLCLLMFCLVFIAQRPLTLELRSKFDLQCYFKGAWNKQSTHASVFLSFHSASFQSRPESTKDGVMLLGVKSSGGEENGELPSVSFLQEFLPGSFCLCFLAALAKAVSPDTVKHWFLGSHSLLIWHCTVRALGAFAGQQKVFPVILRPRPQTSSRAWKIVTS